MSTHVRCLVSGLLLMCLVVCVSCSESSTGPKGSLSVTLTGQIINVASESTIKHAELRWNGSVVDEVDYPSGWSSGIFSVTVNGVGYGEHEVLLEVTDEVGSGHTYQTLGVKAVVKDGMTYNFTDTEFSMFIRYKLTISK